MNTHKRMVMVHDILNKRFVYIDVDKILAIEIKPFVTDPGDVVKKQAKAAIILDTVSLENNKIVIDETAEDLFKRIAIGTGCIKLKLERIAEISLDNLDISYESNNEEIDLND